MADKAHAEWLKARKNGIGGSDAACILGCGFKSNYALWEEKTGRREAPDIGHLPVVKFGKDAEAAIRALFILDYPQYEVKHDEYGMVANRLDTPWLFATLDGDLTERETKRKGVLEIKTTEIFKKVDWGKWSGDIPIPQVYYIQVLHQLLATGYEFAIVKARIKHSKGVAVKHIPIERADVESDLAHLLEKEKAFWKCVVEDRRPNLILPSI